jgi:hypothetical protein
LLFGHSSRFHQKLIIRSLARSDADLSFQT